MRLTRFLGMTLAVLAAACSDSASGPGSGSNRTQVFITDSPFPYDAVARVDMHIVRIDASTSLDTTGLDPAVWVPVVEPRRTVNLLELTAGAKSLLGEVDLAAGQYRALRVVINTALSSITMKDGSAAAVQWPVQGQLTLYAYVEDPLAVEPAGARIVLDFDVGRSFLPLGANGFVFLPWIRAVNEAATGSLAGTVWGGGTIEGGGGPLANATVTMLRGNFQLSPGTWWVAATGRTGADGAYRIGYLGEATYIVRVEATVGGSPSCLVFSDVVVQRGAIATLNAALPNGPLSCGGGTDTSGTDTTGTTPGPIASISISPAMQTANLNDSLGVFASLSDANGSWTTGQVVWTLSDSTLVAIQGQGGQWMLLRAKKAGTLTVTAAANGKTGSGTIVIQP